MNKQTRTHSRENLSGNRTGLNESVEACSRSIHPASIALALGSELIGNKGHVRIDVHRTRNRNIAMSIAHSIAIDFSAEVEAISSGIPAVASVWVVAIHIAAEWESIRRRTLVERTEALNNSTVRVFAGTGGEREGGRDVSSVQSAVASGVSGRATVAATIPSGANGRHKGQSDDKDHETEFHFLESERAREEMKVFD